jgi:hypothetical protein
MGGIKEENMAIKISYLNEREDVYDITVKDNHNFYANDILVHNCGEIDLPSVPLSDINDDTGRIALCTLSAINWGNIKSPADFEKPCTLAVRGLDALLSYQNYPVKAAELATKEFRPLGVGIINLAYFLAKNDVSYSDPRALALVDEYAEAWSYYLLKASADLAVEQGPCERWKDLKSADGRLPIDTYKREVDILIAPQERMPWQQLRQQIIATGQRNATLTCLMPAECQALSNTLTLKDGSSQTLEHIIRINGNIDIDEVHNKMFIGQRFEFIKPVELSNSTAYECYYNGIQELDEIEFEDGSKFRFTKKHKLLVNRNGVESWIQVKDLTEEDEIVSFHAK